jgi:hypothetical protein
MSAEPKPPAFWQEFAKALFTGVVSATVVFLIFAFVALLLFLLAVLTGFHT